MSARLTEARSLIAQIDGALSLRTAAGRAADQIFADLERHFPKFGITRVGDLTGLDTIGLPVWAATRPNSRSLSVSQGKGLTDCHAKLTAVMESIENAFAEDWELQVTTTGSWRDLEKRGLRAVPLDETMRCSSNRIGRDTEHAWVPGVSLRTGETVFAPYELIGLDFCVDAPWDRGAFRMSSIGLAAGDSLAQATLHAVLEVLENDATAPIEIFGIASNLAQPILYRPGHDAELDQAVERVRAAGVEPCFINVTGTAPLPVIGCFIERELHTPNGPGLCICGGFACRHVATHAALAALLEAVQSRATDIAGARDDITPEDYEPTPNFLENLKGEPIYMDRLGSCSPASRDAPPLQQLRRVLKAVFQSGSGDIFLFPLGGDDYGIRIVRVLATRLKAATDDGIVSLGPEALEAFFAQGTL